MSKQPKHRTPGTTATRSQRAARTKSQVHHAQPLYQLGNYALW